VETFFKQINIPDFHDIQKELIDLVDIDSKKLTHAYSVDEKIIIQKCPIFTNWLFSKKKMPIRAYRFYITEPYGKLGPHIDGTKTLRSPFGLNIPLKNYNNTYMHFYDCPEENIKNLFKNGYLGGCVPKDKHALVEKCKLELINPYFVRNDIMHSISNPNPTYRIIFTVRWILHPTKGRTIQEVFNID